MSRKLRIGELLVQNRVISEEQLEAALREQKTKRKRLGQTLIDLGYLSEDDLLNFLAEQLRLPFVDLRNKELSEEAVLKLPEAHARRFRAIILEDTGREVVVGMADPTDILAVDAIQRILKRTVRQTLVRESDLLRTIDRIYRRTEEISSLAVELDEELGGTELEVGEIDASTDESAVPVARLLRSLFDDAISNSASDIHIEPDENVLRIRQRVDGVLQEHVMKETRIATALVLRLKLMAGLDISEKRLPQDGRFDIRVRDRTIDVRLATMPVQHGESVVMRLLDQSSHLHNLDLVGMPPDVLSRLRGIIHRPHGLLLVTGPTGSGKTTTLYAALHELNEPGKKIITVEDPVEYRTSRINQIQVNPKIDLTFARILRSTLRHDPDIVMVGEMRDSETAEIGLRAAMTGHLVLSTLHTNDAISSSLRLIDMGAEPYLVASALRASMAQRLVRKICEHCKEPYELSGRERVWLKAIAGPDAAESVFMHGRGCRECNNTGCRGRVGVYELLELDGDMAEALRQHDAGAYARAAKARPDFRPLTAHALEYAKGGQISLLEVFRVAETLFDPTEGRVEAVPEAPEDTPVIEAETPPQV